MGRLGGWSLGSLDEIVIGEVLAIVDIGVLVARLNTD